MEAVSARLGLKHVEAEACLVLSVSLEDASLWDTSLPIADLAALQDANLLMTENGSVNDVDDQEDVGIYFKRVGACAYFTLSKSSDYNGKFPNVFSHTGL